MEDRNLFGGRLEIHYVDMPGSSKSVYGRFSGVVFPIPVFCFPTECLRLTEYLTSNLLHCVPRKAHPQSNHGIRA
jgi:hypothetical protein